MLSTRSQIRRRNGGSLYKQILLPWCVGEGVTFYCLLTTQYTVDQQTLPPTTKETQGLNVDDVLLSKTKHKQPVFRLSGGSWWQLAVTRNWLAHRTSRQGAAWCIPHSANLSVTVNQLNLTDCHTCSHTQKKKKISNPNLLPVLWGICLGTACIRYWACDLWL